MELDDDCYECECPNCRAVAIKCDWEIVEGGCMNAYWSVSCSACGYADGVYPDSEDDYDDHDYDAESAARRAEIDAQIQAWIEADDAEDAWHFLAPLLMQKTDFLTLLNACNAQRQC
jgi:hypothetical protein